MVNKEQVESLLRKIKYPGFSRDIVSFGLVRNIDCENNQVAIKLALTTADPEIPSRLEQSIRDVLLEADKDLQIQVDMEVKAPARTPGHNAADKQTTGASATGDIRFIVAVASGKGGVGKSTFSVNLACALEQILSRAGKPRSVGLMDCDIYGPSIPLMIGVNAEPQIEGNYLQPLENFGVRVMSMGLLVDENTPIVWRGPMVMKTIQQFAENVAWGALEVLVVDLPPGTGDAQLSLAQTLPLDGAVIITTPQTAAVQVAKRGAMMFEKVNVPVLGVVENMSHWSSPEGKAYYLFGKGGGEKVAKGLQTELLGQVPLDQDILQGGDHGIPVVVGYPDSVASREITKIAQKILSLLQKKN
jgi:ATP-binding protein involved in chromosome partitioning